MRRNIWPWLVAAVVPACGANIDVGGPRANAAAGSSAISDVDTGTITAGSKGTSETTDPMPAGGGTAVSTAGSGASGTSAQAGSSSTTTTPTGRYTGTFKVLVLSRTLEFHHDSIPECQQLLTTLGQTS